jgi:isopentenyl diphosphate isomerase/L-lactate dehydrogenase-like FMN-dependent dehydrogenase
MPSGAFEDCMTTEDIWCRMQRRVPPVVSEYFRGGADAEITLRANVRAFQQSFVNAEGATRFGAVDTSTTVLDQRIELPWYITPVGSLRTLYPKAEAVAAKVAGQFGTVMGLSTLSGTPMEEVAEASINSCWFQLYLCGGRETALRGIARAKKAGFTALVLTIDTSVSGQRLVHARMKPLEAMRSWEGLTLHQKLQSLRRIISLAPQMLPRFNWLLDFYADHGVMEFVNIIDAEGKPMAFTDIGSQLAESAITWSDLEWIKQAWGSDQPLIVKGVHCAEDAQRAEDCGANGVVWSNHGGRQMDRVQPTLHMVRNEMPKLKDSKLEFLMDGGVRNGTDIFIALTYGIRAVGIGRAMAAGIGAGGETGLRRVFEILKADLVRAMQLTGVDSIEQIQEAGASLRRDNQLHGNDYLPPFVY